MRNRWNANEFFSNTPKVGFSPACCSMACYDDKIYIFLKRMPGNLFCNIALVDCHMRLQFIPNFLIYHFLNRFLGR